MTYRNNFVGRGMFQGHIKTWAVLFATLLATLLTGRYLMLHGPAKFAAVYGPVYFLILNFVTISTLGFVSSVAFRYWNHPRAFDQAMASHSYNIYLGHYVFVIGLQLILLTMSNLPGLLKFGIVSILAVILSLGLSRFLLKPFPRAAIATAFGLFLAMVLFIHP